MLLRRNWLWLPFACGLSFMLSRPGFAAPSSSSEWAAAFPPAAVATYFEGKNRTVLVVSAGQRSGEASSAQSELEAALRRSGKLLLVMDGGMLSVSASDDDASIVKKAAVQPVELIAIVRVFEGVDGAAPTAVVTLYDKQGTAHLAFTVTRGRALTAHQGSGVDVALNGAAVEARVRTVKDDLDEITRRNTFERKRLWFIEGRAADSSFKEAYVNNEELSRSEFFSMVGREDLVRAVDTRSRMKKWLILPGLLVAAAGGAMLIPDAFNPCVRYEGSLSGSCLQHARPSMLIPSLAVMGVGLAAFTVGIALPSFSISEGEAEKLGEAYNEKLLHDLDVPIDSISNKVEKPKPMHLEAVVTPQFAGAVLRGEW
jgi:hypothetical protein